MTQYISVWRIWAPRPAHSSRSGAQTGAQIEKYHELLLPYGPHGTHFTAGPP
jgi:hypothetical protein